VSTPQAGAEYVRTITALESDRCARAAFQELALTLAPPRGALFDFGAGAGIDARFFAERGLSVHAYDIDLRMRSYFAAHCRDLINAGRITVETGGYEDFLARDAATAAKRADLVIANFAPLNLIGDLSVLFAKFHSLTSGGGKVLASVLNPFFVGDLKYLWWWRNLPRLLLCGRLEVSGAQGMIVRRRLAILAADCAPWFTLERVFRGLPARNAREAAGIGLASAGPGLWLRLAHCRFMFLLFRRESVAAAESAPP
jgi:SAM-dependent methyltransferase